MVNEETPEGFMFVLQPLTDPCARLAMRAYIIAARAIDENDIADELEELMKEHNL